MEGLKVLNEKLLADFECVVCTEHMHPPIVQCVEGHSVCNECHKKLGRCPTCRQTFDVRCRPVVLERLHGKLVFPCRFRERGCREERQGVQIQEHEARCAHAPSARTSSRRCATTTNASAGRYHYLALLEELADLYVDA